MPIILEDLKKHLRFVKNIPSNQEARFICPFCSERGMGEDHRGHLYINLAKGTYYCHRCNASGNINSLNLQLGTSIQMQELQHQAKNNLDFLHKKILSVKVEGLKKTFRSLYPLVSEKNSHDNAQQAIQYLLNRGLSPQHIKSYGWGLIDKYPDYVFVPLIINKELRGWQGRLFKNTSYKKPIKYYTLPAGTALHEILFNFDNVRYFSKVVVTEGVFDAISVGLQGTATFGKTLSQTQKLLLAKNKFKKIIFAYDRDAQKTSEKLAYEMKGYADKTGYVKWYPELEVKDIGEIFQTTERTVVHKFLKECVVYV